MKKDNDFGGLIIIILIIALGVFSALCDKNSNNNESDYRENIGKVVIINHDTTIVTDYSRQKERYYLSNGSVISKELLEKLNK